MCGRVGVVCLSFFFLMLQVAMKVLMSPQTDLRATTLEQRSGRNWLRCLRWKKNTYAVPSKGESTFFVSITSSGTYEWK